MGGTIAAALVLVLILAGLIALRTGTVNSYVKARFVENMADMGIVFDAESFTLELSPLQLHLRNATFKDKVTGKDLFSCPRGPPRDDGKGPLCPAGKSRYLNR